MKISIDIDDTTKGKEIISRLRQGFNFVEIDNEFVRVDSFPLEIPKNVDFPDGYPNCCDFHKKMFEGATNWYRRFPHCCDYHKKIGKKSWFSKDDYINLPLDSVDKLIYMNAFMAESFDKEDWFEKITEYIEYVILSFGNPPIGLTIFIRGLNQLLSIDGLITYNMSDDQKLELLIWLEKSEVKENINLNQLFLVFQKWIQSFPDLPVFNQLKNTFRATLPMDLVLYDQQYNRYTGITKSRVKNELELIKVLVHQTKILLSKINFRKIVAAQNIDKSQIEYNLIVAKHTLTQKALLSNYDNHEEEYMNILEKWLDNEVALFQSLSNLSYQNEVSSKLKLISGKQNQFELAITEIKDGNSKVINLIDKLTERQKKYHDELISEIDRLEEDSPLLKDLNQNIQDLKSVTIKGSQLDSEVDTFLSDGDISAKHKFKFIIPLLIFRYEAEIELGAKQKLPKSWKNFKRIFIKD